METSLLWTIWTTCPTSCLDTKRHSSSLLSCQLSTRPFPSPSCPKPLIPSPNWSITPQFPCIPSVSQRLSRMRRKWISPITTFTHWIYLLWIEQVFCFLYFGGDVLEGWSNSIFSSLHFLDPHDVWTVVFYVSTTPFERDWYHLGHANMVGNSIFKSYA